MLKAQLSTGVTLGAWKVPSLAGHSSQHQPGMGKSQILVAEIGLIAPRVTSVLEIANVNYTDSSPPTV